MITNSMNVGIPKEGAGTTCVHESEVTKFLRHKSKAFHLWVVFHELFGHGTGKLLAEDGDGSFNFDAQNPPINLLTGKPIDSWYRPGQTWTGLFGDIATSVDECRAECVGAYLMSEMELLALFGFSETTEIKGSDCALSPPPQIHMLGFPHVILVEYNMYMQLGVAGLRALENYILEDHVSCPYRMQLGQSLIIKSEMGSSA